MRVLIQLLKRAGLQILLLLLCYFLCRSLFTLINLDRFEGLTVSEYFRLAFHGLRYDISTVVSINGLYFILLLLPLPVWRSRAYLRTLQWLFIVTNVLAFAFEISDWAYFPFSLKRSTSDVLDMISRKGDFVALLPHFITDYWYAPFGILLLIIGLYHVNKRICKYTQLQTLTLWNLRTALLQTLALILVTGLSVIGMRGGLQLIPLGNGNALQAVIKEWIKIKDAK